MFFINTDDFFLPNVKFKAPNPPLKCIKYVEQVPLMGLLTQECLCLCLQRNGCSPGLLLHSEFSLESSPNRQTVSPREKNPLAVSLPHCALSQIHMQIISSWGLRHPHTPSPESLSATETLCPLSKWLTISPVPHDAPQKNKIKVFCGQAS